MRRNQHIRRVPQRVITRKRLRVRDVEGGAADLVCFQGGDEGSLVDDGAAGDVGDVRAARVAGVEEGEFGGREEVRCVLAVGVCELVVQSREGRGSVKEDGTYVRGTPITNRSISCFRKLCRSSFAVPLYHALGRLPSGSPVPGTMKPSSLFDSGVLRGLAVYAITSIPIALATLATTPQISTPIKHPHQTELGGRSLTLPPNTPIPQHPHPLPHPITHPHPRALIPPPLPLQVIQLRIPMAMHQIHHNHPLRDLRAVHAIRAAQRDLAIRVDRMLRYVIRARRKKLNQLGLRDEVRGVGEPEEGGDVAGLREQVGRDVVDGDFPVFEVRVEVLDFQVGEFLF